MKSLSNVIENLRLTDGPLRTTRENGRNGAFRVPLKSGKVAFCIISDGQDWRQCGLPGEPWEHVSVSFPDRIPTWDEMDEIRHVFWEPDECVIQFHPPDSQRINFHPYVLHLWKPTQTKLPLPPTETIGPKTPILKIPS